MRATAAAVLAGLGAASSVWAQCQGCFPSVTYTLSGALVIQVGGSWTNAPFIGAFGSSVPMTGPDQGALFRVTMTMSVPAGAATTAHGGALGGPVTWDPTIQFGS